MKNNKMIQQGDVILYRTNIDISNAVKIDKDKRGIVLAEGEHTGHFHGIEIEDDEAELIRIGEKMLLNVKTNSVTLKHQEHGSVTIDKGVWEVGQVVEKDWLQDIVRNVVD